jgi:hypothetical protein
MKKSWIGNLLTISGSPSKDNKNKLAVAAFVVVLACAWFAVYASNLTEYAKGIITLLLGRFMGYIDDIFNYEFGTTRSSKEKDKVIAATAPNVMLKKRR